MRGMLEKRFIEGINDGSSGGRLHPFFGIILDQVNARSRCALQMTNVLILSDHTTGTLFRKYLTRGRITVEFATSADEAIASPAEILMLDVSRIRIPASELIPAYFSKTGCANYILLVSMEDYASKSNDPSQYGNLAVTTIVKPIKLSQLLSVISGILDGK
jgi:hypothetical protein